MRDKRMRRCEPDAHQMRTIKNDTLVKSHPL